MKKYGLQLRVPPAQQRKLPARPPLPKPLGFQDEDEDDVEREIIRQASKNKALKEVEEQHKKALEEDPSVFDYDGVYDDMKQKVVCPQVQDRQERKPKYIQHLIKKAEERQREHDIIYERKLAKERSKDDHLYAEKDKFITSAYKKKLAEQAKWIEEERLRELREEKDDVTKKSDLSDFYFNIGKNVAFGAKEIDEIEAKKLAESRKQETQEAKEMDTSERHQSHTSSESSRVKEGPQAETSAASVRSFEPSDSKTVSDKRSSDVSAEEKSSDKQPSSNQPNLNHHKRSEDALAAAKERFLARKRSKVE